MRVILILALVFATSCQRSTTVAGGNIRRSNSPAKPQAVPPQQGVSSLYKLSGAASDTSIYSDLGHCLDARKNYAQAVDLMYGNGSDTQLKCVPA